MEHSLPPVKRVAGAGAFHLVVHQRNLRFFAKAFKFCTRTSPKRIQETLDPFSVVPWPLAPFAVRAANLGSNPVRRIPRFVLQTLGFCHQVLPAQRKYSLMRVNPQSSALSAQPQYPVSLIYSVHIVVNNQSHSVVP